MEIFLLYLFTRLDVVHDAATIFTILSGGALGMMVFVTTMEPETTLKKAKNISGIVFSVCLVISILIPSKKDAAIILGGYAVLEAAKTDTAKRIADKSIAVIEKTLDSYLKENK